MSKWQPVVQAQLFFAQKNIKALRAAMDVKSSSSADRKFLANGAVLSVRRLWIDWLNEWAGYLKPKQAIRVLESSEEFFADFGMSAEVSVLKQNLTSPDSWLTALLQIERSDGIALKRMVDCLSDIDGGDENERDASNLSNELLVRNIDVRVLSIFNGLEDLEGVFEHLNTLICRTREQHSEY